MRTYLDAWREHDRYEDMSEFDKFLVDEAETENYEALVDAMEEERERAEQDAMEYAAEDYE